MSAGGMSREELVAKARAIRAAQPKPTRSGCLHAFDEEPAQPRWEPPVVAVQHPHVRSDDGSLTPITDALYVFCTDCGDVTDWQGSDRATRERLQREAATHATDKHEGLVDAVGWVR